MIRKPLSWNIKQVVKMISNNNMTFDNPIQRPSNQWKEDKKSLLIHSILTMFVPEIYTIQVKTEKGNIYDVIDGKQRLTTIKEFLNDEFTLTELEPIRLESTNGKFNISGLKFSELPEDVQEEIKGYTLTIKAIELEEDDDEENIIDTIFYRLNNGTPVSKEHLALVSARKNIQEFAKNTLKENPLFKDVAHFPAGALKNSNREMTILQSIVFVSGLDYESFSAKHIEKFFKENEISEEVLITTEGYFVDIAEALNHEYNKFANKINISSLISLLHNNEDTEMVQKFIKWYSTNIKTGDSYKRYCGAGCTKKENVQSRVKGLQSMFEGFSSKLSIVADEVPNLQVAI